MNGHVQNVMEHCKKCEDMCKLMEKMRSDDEIKEQELLYMRRKCQRCRRGDNGIYKADAILTALLLDKMIQDRWKKNLTPGKKPTLERKYGRAIYALREGGKTIKQIASLLGLSPTSVHKVLKSKKQIDK